MLYFHLLFRINLFRTDVFGHCGYDQGIFPYVKTLPESICPAFSYSFEQYSYDCKSWHLQAGAVFVLASYCSWLSRLPAALWPGKPAQKVKAVSVIKNQHESNGISEPPYLNCHLLLNCFLIRGQETPTLLSGKENAKFGEKREIQHSSPIAVTGSNSDWILEVNLPLKGINQNWFWYLNKKENKKVVSFKIIYIVQKSSLSFQAVLNNCVHEAIGEILLKSLPRGKKKSPIRFILVGSHSSTESIKPKKWAQQARLSLNTWSSSQQQEEWNWRAAKAVWCLAAAQREERTGTDSPTTRTDVLLMYH